MTETACAGQSSVTSHSLAPLEGAEPRTARDSAEAAGQAAEGPGAASQAGPGPGDQSWLRREHSSKPRESLAKCPGDHPNWKSQMS
jgi:hypothetical protein